MSFGDRCYGQRSRLNWGWEWRQVPEGLVSLGKNLNFDTE